MAPLGHEWGGSRLDQQRISPPRGLMLHSFAPAGGFTAQHPPPQSGCQRAPPDIVQGPRSLRLGQEGWRGGVSLLSPPPDIFLKRFPTNYWLSQKLIVYKYSKLRKKRVGRGGAGGGTGGNHTVCGGQRPAVGLFPPGNPKPNPKAGGGWLLSRNSFAFPKKKKGEKGERPRGEQGQIRKSKPSPGEEHPWLCPCGAQRVPAWGAQISRRPPHL